MKNIVIIAIVLLLVQCEPLVPQKNIADKKILFENHQYEAIVGNVNLYPLSNGQANPLDNPVISLRENTQLLLDFDLLSDQFENLSAKIIHCNKDWSRSQLREMEYLDEINNYRITDFDYSLNTVQPYINYRLILPQPSISGNFILAVFRRANPNDLLLTRRFSVYEPVASIEQIVRVSNNISKREIDQQLDFSISYGNLFVSIPTRDLSTVILQNHNWRTAIRDIPPTLIRANEGSIDYRHLDETTCFPGWNEFRWTDLRTLNVAGRNVARIQNTGNEVFAQLGLDKSRNQKGYSLNFQDINGNYVIENNDPGESFLNTDYADVTFFLNSDRINGEVYVMVNRQTHSMADVTADQIQDYKWVLKRSS